MRSAFLECHSLYRLFFFSVSGATFLFCMCGNAHLPGDWLSRMQPYDAHSRRLQIPSTESRGVGEVQPPTVWVSLLNGSIKCRGKAAMLR